MAGVFHPAPPRTAFPFPIQPFIFENPETQSATQWARLFRVFLSLHRQSLEGLDEADYLKFHMASTFLAGELKDFFDSYSAAHPDDFDVDSLLTAL